MKRLLMVSMAALALALVPMAAAADEGEGGQHFGPFAGASGDSGTCGPDWALDTFTRNFAVHENSDGTFRLVETFSNGHFVTIAGPSPNSCNSGTYNGSLVAAGVKGQFGGFLNGTVTGGTYNPNGCRATPGACDTTSGFVLAVFGPSAKYTCVDGGGSCSFFFGYFAPRQGLKSHIWINASPDLGGNRGDIASTTV
ncbi:MAG TPA: hypothetical protein VJT14_11440 [Candidatus Dormibacteraeota bacterium]|nr:hypothetical protein [Candidatus Dormibacteraeota bacterium]